MKHKLFQTLMLLVTIGSFTSCTKEPADPPALPAVETATGNTLSGILPIAKKSLASITMQGNPVAAFTFDGSGRVTKVVGPKYTTDYTYNNNTLTIKRYVNNNPLSVKMNLTGPLSTNGQVTSLTGKTDNGGYLIESAYTFYYDADTHLIAYKGKFTDFDGSVTYTSTQFGWKDGNLVSSYYKSSAGATYSKLFSYDLTLPDKRGVWNDVQDIWAGSFFGYRNKNLCTKVSEKNNYTGLFVPTFTYTWQLDADKYPVKQTIVDKNNMTTVYDYVFFAPFVTR